MGDDGNFGFAKLVPGFDFLQSLARGAAQNIPQLPHLSNWVAPTLNVEELEKRITELKAVHFWLDQNSKVLGATIQALEVQKMTLATLQGMNFNMGEVANALKMRGAEMAAGMQDAGAAAAATTGAARETAGPGQAAAGSGAKAAAGTGAAGAIDPMQWWGALTQQFQQIAAGAMKDVAQMTGGEATKNRTAGASGGAGKAAKKAPARKAAAAKGRAKK